MAKVDLSQAQATVLEKLLVDGPQNRWDFGTTTLTALKKRVYIEERGGRWVIEITPLGIDTLGRFPYADKHIDLIIEWTGENAGKEQRGEYSKFALSPNFEIAKIRNKIQWLGKVNAALAVAAPNGQPPSEPEKPTKTPSATVKPKPVRKPPVGKWELFTRQGGVCPVCATRMQYGSTLQVHDHHAVVLRSDLPKKQQQERGIDDPINRVIVHAKCHNEIQRDRQWGIKHAIGEHGEEAVKAMCQRLLPKTWRGLYKWSA